MPERLLLVDDDPNVLSAYRRALHGRWETATACGGPEGLEALRDDGPFAVILSDMQMPGMDGIKFLAKARDVAPDSVRIMLTGHADLNTTVQAVNEGHIFRFLTKPCPADQLTRALEAGIAQYRLIVAERQLLEGTLNGSIRLLTDILSMVNPLAFSQASRLKRCVGHIVARLGLPNAWQFELAAMLSQIGCVALLPNTLEKVYVGEQLSASEQKMFASHPAVGCRLLIHIPRLEQVARMIERQHEPFSASPDARPPAERDVVALGAQVLKVAVAFDLQVSQGTPAAEAVARLGRQPGECDPAIVRALKGLNVRPAQTAVRAIMVREIDTRMVLDQDVKAKNGLLLVTKGQEVTLPIRERLLRWAEGVGIEEPIRVVVPTAEAPVLAPAAT